MNACSYDFFFTYFQVKGCISPYMSENVLTREELGEGTTSKQELGEGRREKRKRRKREGKKRIPL
jgi:hypothetical protein